MSNENAAENKEVACAECAADEKGLYANAMEALNSKVAFMLYGAAAMAAGMYGRQYLQHRNTETTTETTEA